MKLFCVISAILLTAFLPSHAAEVSCEAPPDIFLSGQEFIIDWERCDFNGDNTVETIVITAKSTESGRPMDGRIIFYRELDGERQQVWEKNGFNPWKIEIGDVDGDGFKEFIIGVWKTSPFDPVMANRPFVYSWDGENVNKKWLGSRLSRRFDDFIVHDINDDGWDELIALEVAPDNMNRVAVYRWDIFGFEWLGCSGELPDLLSLIEDNEIPTVITCSGILTIHFENDQVLFESPDPED